MEMNSFSPFSLIAFFPYQSSHRVVLLAEFPYQVATNESGGAGNEDVHIAYIV